MQLHRKLLYSISLGLTLGASSLAFTSIASAGSPKPEVKPPPMPVAMGEQDCDVGKNAVHKDLREMVLQHFIDYQQFAKKGILQKHGSNYIESKVKETFQDAAADYAKVLGRILKESSGDPTCVTGMNGKEFGTFQPKTKLSRWQRVGKLADMSIKENLQTNYGLVQLSGDRLTTATSSPVQHTLLGVYQWDDKAHIKTRKLFDYYQDVANNAGSAEAIRLCGTAYLFEEGKQGPEGMKQLIAAMDSIKSCSIGGTDPDDGYADTEKERLCYARWITLCPNLNFDLGMIASDKYFAKVTLASRPRCTETLRALIDTSPKLVK